MGNNKTIKDVDPQVRKAIDDSLKVYHPTQKIFGLHRSHYKAIEGMGVKLFVDRVQTIVEVPEVDALLKKNKKDKLKARVLRHKIKQMRIDIEKAEVEIRGCYNEEAFIDLGTKLGYDFDFDVNTLEEAIVCSVIHEAG